MGRFFRTTLCQIVGLMVACFVVGCAAVTPSVPQEARPPIFYPSLPNPPRIQFLTSFSSSKELTAGKPRSAFSEFVVGKTTEKDISIKKPYGVALSEGKLYVVDTRGAGYAVFDLKQQAFKLVRGSGAGKMKKPINITVDRDGTKYVTDVMRNQILAFNQDDHFVRAYGVIDQFKPGDVVILGDRLYVSDLKHHNIQVLDKQSGQVLFAFGDKNTLGWPTNMTVGSDGYLYVADTGNFRVHKFMPDGTVVKSYGVLGTRLGQFARPKGVAVDRQGRMYVVDAAFENVQIFDSEGQLLLFFGEPGGSPENINLPTAVVIDYETVSLFQKYADPKFKLEYVIAVASQFGRSKVNVFGFGKMQGMDYTSTKPAATKRP